MAQFDVYENPNLTSRKTTPYLLDVQTDLLGNLATRVVVPLVASGAMTTPGKHLNPTFDVGKNKVIMSTAEIAGVSVKSIGKQVCSLKQYRNKIVAALDFLITGI
ncbi:MAG TPA: CcdB family protein [Desulfuromonadales bacterium]|nr:CcdB family protein [Desulfuromonadales bacterium]